MDGHDGHDAHDAHDDAHEVPCTFATLRQHPELTGQVVRACAYLVPPPCERSAAYDAEWLRTRPLFVMLAIAGDGSLHGCAVARANLRGTVDQPATLNPWLTVPHCRHGAARGLLAAAAAHHRRLGRLPGKQDPPRLPLYTSAAEHLLDPRDWTRVSPTAFALRCGGPARSAAAPKDAWVVSTAPRR